MDRSARWRHFLGSCFATVCPTVNRFLNRTLSELALEVDNGKEQWRADDHLRAPDLRGPAGKRRTLDPACKAQALQAHLPNRDPRYWLRKHLVALLEQGARTIQKEQFLSLAFDGGRIRKPPVDVNLCLAYLHQASCTMILPPMVPGQGLSYSPVGSPPHSNFFCRNV